MKENCHNIIKNADTDNEKRYIKNTALSKFQTILFFYSSGVC